MNVDSDITRFDRFSEIRAKLESAVLIRAYDRIDAETLSGRAVTVDYVVEERAHEITGYEGFYDGQCIRITFNEDVNDYVDAYFTLNIAGLMLNARR